MMQLPLRRQSFPDSGVVDPAAIDQDQNTGLRADDRGLSADRPTNGKGQKKGSVSLEAVLVLPVLMVLCWFFLSQIIAVTAEIKLGGALYRTAGEFSLLGPAVRLAETARQSMALPAVPGLAEGMQDVDTALARLLPGLSLEQHLENAVVDMLSTGLIGPVLLDRLQYWLDEAAAGQPGTEGSSKRLWRRSIRDIRLFLDWQADRQQLWLILSWHQQHALGSRQRILKKVVPLWTGFDGTTEKSQVLADSVWMLDNFTRGQTIRQQMGATLPYDFPVIAEFSNGEATAIKSMDLTAPAYARQTGFEQQVMSFIDSLASFSGASYSKSGQEICIDGDAIARKRLLLVIPQNSSQDWLEQSLAGMGDLAVRAGIDLQVVRTGNSTRYPADPP